ncbi:hypothetical protein FDP41_009802 [Naegleria fowleri]|uniref:Protein kinase domain-containing protein n=1 Tax=Naegleria fowleri TaxID=5763 RepID=A0A6A5BBQ1_NAEFO|nr:uncharacterized protein FDP41_009802 [Naegleria fowleri]KAF0972106.1 hypothetical protein FDP41_009802 [Naegleria fowleri]
MFQHMKDLFIPKSRSRDSDASKLTDMYEENEGTASATTTTTFQRINHSIHARLKESSAVPSNSSSHSSSGSIHTNNNNNNTTTTFDMDPSNSSEIITTNSSVNNNNSSSSSSSSTTATATTAVVGHSLSPPSSQQRQSHTAVSGQNANGSPNSPRRNALFMFNRKSTTGILGGNNLVVASMTGITKSKSNSSNTSSSSSSTVLCSSGFDSPQPFIIVNLKSGEDLVACDRNGKSDPFCEFTYRYLPNNNTNSQIDSSQLRGDYLVETKKSSTMKKTLNPMWGESFFFSVRNVEQVGNDDYFVGAIKDELIVTVWDFDLFQSNDFMGCVTVPLSQLLQNQTQKFYLKLEGVPKGFIYLEITAIHCGLNIDMDHSVQNSLTATTPESESSPRNTDAGQDFDIPEIFTFEKLLETNSTFKNLYEEYMSKQSRYEYELIKPLGEGAVGLVFKAMRTLTSDTDANNNNSNNENVNASPSIVALKKVTIDHWQTALEILYEIEVIRYLDQGILSQCENLVHHHRIFIETIKPSEKRFKRGGTHLKQLAQQQRKNSIQSLLKDYNDEIVICFEMPLFNLGDMQKFLEMKQRKGKKLEMKTFISYLMQLAHALSLMHHPELRHTQEHVGTRDGNFKFSSSTREQQLLQQQQQLMDRSILCHRDIKPQNIFFSDDEYRTIKLADYSFLVRHDPQESESNGSHDGGMDDSVFNVTSPTGNCHPTWDTYGLKTTKLCGSIPHMAPELYIQMISDDPTLTPTTLQSNHTNSIEMLTNTDIFSFGVVAYQLVTFDTKVDHSFYRRIMPPHVKFPNSKTDKKKQKEVYNEFMEELEFELFKLVDSNRFDMEENMAFSLKDLILKCLKWDPMERPTALQCRSLLLELMNKYGEEA